MSEYTQGDFVTHKDYPNKVGKVTHYLNTPENQRQYLVVFTDGEECLALPSDELTLRDFKRGDRVEAKAENRGMVVAITEGLTCKVGFDDLGLGYVDKIAFDDLTLIDPSPAIETLPQIQRDILLALHEKRTTEGQSEAHQTLQEYGYITADAKLTPYGDYVMRRWVEAEMPVTEVEPVVEVIEPRELPIVFQVGHKKFIRIPDDRGG